MVCGVGGVSRAEPSLASFPFLVWILFCSLVALFLAVAVNHWLARCTGSVRGFYGYGVSGGTVLRHAAVFDCRTFGSRSRAWILRESSHASDRNSLVVLSR